MKSVVTTFSRFSSSCWLFSRFLDNNISMFVVERVARGHRYLYLVESVREGKVVRQRTIKALGRKDALVASGELDRLASSIVRHSERSVILSDIDAGRIASHRIGGPLLFGRLWERLGIGAVLEDQLAGRGFGFAVERAVFVATLHRSVRIGLGPRLHRLDAELRHRGR